MVDNIPVMAHHLSFDQIETFNEDGFLAVESLLDDDDLVPLEQEYAEVLDEVSLPLNRGGIVLFDKHNFHCAGVNRSSDLRWSFDLRYNRTGQPTGRPAFPGFVARSRAHPESELQDAAAWKRLWDEARDNILSGRYTDPIFEQKRWDDNSKVAICA